MMALAPYPVVVPAPVSHLLTAGIHACVKSLCCAQVDLDACQLTGHPDDVFRGPPAVDRVPYSPE